MNNVTNSKRGKDGVRRNKAVAVSEIVAPVEVELYANVRAIITSAR